MKDTVAILIPVHNGLNYTQHCISAVKASINKVPAGNDHFHLIIIDDGSTDGTSFWITTNHPDVHILSGDGNLWWSGAINRGIEYAMNTLHTTYILLWNNDITPSQNYFHFVLEIVSNQEFPIVCSMIYNKEMPDTLISTGGYFNQKNGKFGLYNYNQKDNKVQLEELNITWFGGMGTLIRHDVFKSVGLFDAMSFPQYHGDSDFGMRATASGYPIHLNQSLKIWNDVRNSGIHRSLVVSDFIRSFSSIKSNYNLKKDILFYRRYATTIWAFRALVLKYGIYIASFVKWKSLSFLGITKNI